MRHLVQRFTTGAMALLLLVCLGPLTHAASKAEIDANVDAALEALYRESAAAKKLADQSHGMLVFPKVVKAGIGIGGEYGEGKLVENGRTVDYYNIAAASIGFQLGAQVKSQILMFMTERALTEFKASEGWEAGVDGSVALVTLGAGEKIDTSTIQDPIIGFVFSNKGLMYNLTLEGSKITRLKK